MDYPPFREALLSTLSEPAPASSARRGVLSTRVPMPWGHDLTYLQIGLVAAIALYAFVLPGDLRYKINALGFGVCHQIAGHSFFIDDHQLPLCARCSGIYLGAISATVLLAVMRRRFSRLPAAHMLVILGVFFGAMVLDGANSTLETFGADIWQSTNILRLLTGGLAGVSFAFFVYPLFNLSMWHRDARVRDNVLHKPLELLGYMLGAGILVALVLDGGDWLYYPIAILSVLGMLTMLTMANTMMVLMFTRRENTAHTFTDALTPILFAVLLSLVELTLLAWGRASLAPFLANNPAGMPLLPG